MVSQLMKSAKRAVRRQSEDWRKEGMIDFAVLKSTDTFSSDVQDWRERAMERYLPPGARGKQVREQQRLTERPYTLSELRQLLDLVLAFREQRFPQSQLIALSQAQAGGRLEGTLYWLYQLARRPVDHPQRQLMTDFATQLSIGALSPWREQPTAQPDFEEFSTPWLDLVEIYDDVRPPKGENGLGGGEA